MEVIFASGVLDDVSESAAFYEREVAGLGRVFLDNINTGIQEIRDTPFLYRIIKGEYRRHLISRFPFGIIYKLNGNIIYIVAVMHLRRKPFYWMSEDM